MELTTFLEHNCFYHIYNRGTNKDTIFHHRKDYYRFLYLWEKYADPIVDTYAYCLLPNHFHFMIKVKGPRELCQIPNIAKLDESQLKHYFSRQFSHLFNAYSKYFNIKYNRVGKLFCERFKRKEVTTEEYFTTLIQYIHTNPVKHEITDDYQDYEYSSYWQHLIDQPTRLKRKEVLDWFGSKNEYEKMHNLRG